jgi:competence protein ComEC
MLLRLPGGETILVDTGGDLRGERDHAATRLLPMLASRGVRALDVLVLSHLHPDHVGSAPALLRAMPVRELWTTGRPLEGRLGEPIEEALRERGVTHRVLARGSPPMRVGELLFEVLGPPDRDGLMDEPLFSTNDGSLVLRAVHGKVRLLLPGDVESEAEDDLLRAGVDLRAELLKAPHHGSSTSSTADFLDAVRPSQAVFCVGHRNQFGFPHAQVQRRYEERGIHLHRTDRGAIRFASDGESLMLLDEAAAQANSALSRSASSNRRELRQSEVNTTGPRAVEIK